MAPMSFQHTQLLTPPPLGHAVPHNNEHAISVQVTSWKDMQGLPLRAEHVVKAQRSGYPRSYIHAYVAQLHKLILTTAAERFGQDASCFAFPSWSHADACVQYIKSRNPAAIAQVEEIRAQPDQDTPCTRLIYASIFKTKDFPLAMDFWRYTGTGISSRSAEDIVKNVKVLTANPAVEEPKKETGYDMSYVEDQHSHAIRERICGLLQRASLRPDISNMVRPSDIYLYPAGMSAIYHCVRMLNSWRYTESVAFGFLYELTPRLLKIYSQSSRFFGIGTEDELGQLEEHVISEHAAGRPVQSVWCECPSNPLLNTVDLARLRRLADRYGFALVVDETIGSFANVDVLPVADVVVTSLSKSFSGKADVMGGSMILNPVSPFYNSFKRILSTSYVSDLYTLDAAVLDVNSQGFLPRAATMSHTTYRLVEQLSSYASLPGSVITKIYHPSILPSRARYETHLRKVTKDFVPSHSALFTLEFESELAASVFFDNLKVHKGPSLGACNTLAQPYVQTVFAREKDWAASYGLHESIIRISVGLEDPASLSRAFQEAFKKANETRSVSNFAGFPHQQADQPHKSPNTVLREARL